MRIRLNRRRIGWLIIVTSALTLGIVISLLVLANRDVGPWTLDSGSSTHDPTDFGPWARSHHSLFTIHHLPFRLWTLDVGPFA